MRQRPEDTPLSGTKLCASAPETSPALRCLACARPSNGGCRWLRDYIFLTIDFSSQVGKFCKNSNLLLSYFFFFFLIYWTLSLVLPFLYFPAWSHGSSEHLAAGEDCCPRSLLPAMRASQGKAGPAARPGAYSLPILSPKNKHPGCFLFLKGKQKPLVSRGKGEPCLDHHPGGILSVQFPSEIPRLC